MWMFTAAANLLPSLPIFRHIVKKDRYPEPTSGCAAGFYAPGRRAKDFAAQGIAIGQESGTLSGNASLPMVTGTMLVLNLVLST